MRALWIQSKSRACGGARSSGSITGSVDGSLPFRCARILSITVGSSMQAMILTCPAQRSQVSMGPPSDRSGCGPIEHPFQPLHLYALWVQVIDWWRSAGVLSNQFSPVG